MRGLFEGTVYSEGANYSRKYGSYFSAEPSEFLQFSMQIQVLIVNYAIGMVLGNHVKSGSICFHSLQWNCIYFNAHSMGKQSERTNTHLKQNWEVI